MASGTKVPREILEQIPVLSAQGHSNYKIADMLGIGESTVRRNKNYDPNAVEPRSKYQFTERQIEIAVKAAEKGEHRDR